MTRMIHEHMMCIGVCVCVCVCFLAMCGLGTQQVLTDFINKRRRPSKPTRTACRSLINSTINNNQYITQYMCSDNVCVLDRLKGQLGVSSTRRSWFTGKKIHAFSICDVYIICFVRIAVVDEELRVAFQVKDAMILPCVDSSSWTLAHQTEHIRTTNQASRQRMACGTTTSSSSSYRAYSYVVECRAFCGWQSCQLQSRSSIRWLRLCRV